jgi:hypothetical protein
VRKKLCCMLLSFSVVQHANSILADRLIDNSYITGHTTAEILRNGTKTDTWALSPLKDNPARKTVWADVEEALDGGTVYFNTAGSFWPNLGGLCRLTSFAFGLPPNVNVYVTPPGNQYPRLTVISIMKLVPI